jgi:hypothetical protein
VSLEIAGADVSDDLPDRADVSDDLPDRADVTDDVPDGAPTASRSVQPTGSRDPRP